MAEFARTGGHFKTWLPVGAQERSPKGGVAVNHLVQDAAQGPDVRGAAHLQSGHAHTIRKKASIVYRQTWLASPKAPWAQKKQFSACSLTAFSETYFPGQ